MTLPGNVSPYLRIEPRAYRAELLARAKRANAEAERLPLSSPDRFNARELARSYELEIERIDKAALVEVVVPLPPVTKANCINGPYSPSMWAGEEPTDEQMAEYDQRWRAPIIHEDGGCTPGGPIDQKPMAAE